MCLKCHKDITEQYPVMHGAVTGIGCLRCHNPHISAIPHLLRDDGPKMCLQCHDFDEENTTAPHADLARKCLDCHFGHGGDHPYFLRQQTSVEQIETDIEQTKEIDGP